MSKIGLCEQSHNSPYCFEKLKFAAFFCDSAIIKHGISGGNCTMELVIVDVVITINENNVAMTMSHHFTLLL